MEENPKRRWLQFSLRGLLLLMVVIAVPLGWTMHKVRQQREVVAALEKVGCKVQYERTNSGAAAAFDWFQDLLGKNAFATVTFVDGSNSQITDAELVHFEGLTQLRGLDLSKTRVSDAGLLHLEGLGQLERLDLSGKRITDTGLANLRGLTELKGLNLAGTPVTDIGLMRLRGLTKLEYLGLSGTQVTDSGMMNLRGLTQLSKLDLERTDVTDAGVQKLKQSIPRLHIRD